MAKKVFAFANQKGGVGKTTTCVNTAAALVKLSKKVLLVDLDPQGNATMGSGVNKSQVEWSCNDVLMENTTPAEAVIENTAAGYDLLPANSDLTQAEISLLQQEGGQSVLAKKLDDLKKVYDYIFLDCPPSLNMLTLNALSASDYVVIAMQCEYYALEGLTDLLKTIEQLKAAINPNLEVFGIAKTMVDSRSRLSMEVSKQVSKFFGKKCFKTLIPRNIKIAEAPSYGLPVIIYDKSSTGALAYIKLAKEFIKRDTGKPVKAKKKNSKKVSKKSSKKTKKTAAKSSKAKSIKKKATVKKKAVKKKKSTKRSRVTA